MNKIVGCLAVVLFLSISLLMACSDGKSEAEVAIKAVDEAVTVTKAEAGKILPDEVKALEDTLAAAKDKVVKGDYKAALEEATALAGKCKEVMDAAKAKSKEVQAAAKATSSDYKHDMGMLADTILEKRGKAISVRQVGRDEDGLLVEWQYPEATYLMGRRLQDGIEAYRVIKITPR